MNVGELLSAGKAVAKATGKVAYENRDVLADGARMGMNAKIKKNQDVDAKTRFRDYMQWRESGEDMEEFAFKRSELTGRPWQEIVENIKFHAGRVQSGGNAAIPPVKPKQIPEVSGSLQPSNSQTGRITMNKPVNQPQIAANSEAKALPGPTKDVRAYLKYKDVQEVLGMRLTSDQDIPHDLLNEFAELMSGVTSSGGDWTTDYGRQIGRELSKIAVDDSATVRDFSPMLRSLFNEAVSSLLIPNYMEVGDVIEKLCALDTRGEYDVIKDKAHRALLIAYNSLN